MVSKHQTFFDNLVNVVDGLDTSSVKSVIGDSINNNRTLSVNQVIRYLETRRSTASKTLAAQLSAAYDVLRPIILKHRESRNNRQDAIDIYEFIDVFELRVLSGRSTNIRKTVSKGLRSVAA